MCQSKGVQSVLMRGVLLALATILVGFHAIAQNTNGRVVGLVTDPAGAVVAGAQVVVTNTGTSAHSEATSDANGNYEVLNLPVGTYIVAVRKEGFSTASTQASELQISQTLRVDVHLVLGAVSQAVSVEAQAAQVETEVPTIGGTVTGATISNLPLNGRNTLDLALTQPGVAPAPSAVLQGSASNAWVASGSTVAIAGGRPETVNYLLDGANNTSLTTNAVVMNPNPDAIAEFRVLTSNYTAEYGRNAGGIISVVTKSGTNQVHGSVFEYVRNEDFDASDYFSNAAGLPRPILKRNQFGGTFGGPVTIPKVINGKDKLFFFFGYQGQRQVQTLVNPVIQVFTPAELSGNYSHSGPNGGPDPGVISFLQANAYFQPNPALAAQGIISPSAINPVSLNIIKAGFIPTSPTGLETPQASGTDNRDEYTGKIDLYATQNDRLSVTLGWAGKTQNAPFYSGGANVAGFSAINELDSRSLSIAYTKTLTPTTINELRASVQRYIQLNALPAKLYPTSPSLGIQINPDSLLPSQYPSPILNFGTGLQVGNNSFGPINIYDTGYNVADTFTWIHSHHTLKAGFSFNVPQSNGHVEWSSGGSFTFSGPDGIGSGNAFADFLLGLPNSYSQGNYAQFYTRQKGYWAFFQDEWRVTPRLLLTFGLRYEYNTPLEDKNGVTAIYVPGVQSQRFVNSPPGLVYPGDPGSPSGDYFPDKKDFAPRIGFAWDPTGSGKTSIRGGFGTFYDSINAIFQFWYCCSAPWFPQSYFGINAPSGSITGPVPFLSQPFQSTGNASPFPYPATSQLPTNLNFIANGIVPCCQLTHLMDPNLKTPFVNQYNVSIQHQFGSSLVAETAYIGNSGHRLLAQMDRDPFILGTANQLVTAQCGGAPCYNYLNTIGGYGHSNYNALLASLTKRVGDWHSLGETFFTAAYTWSHGLDNASGWIGTPNTDVPYYNHNQFYGNSDYDIRQRFVLSGGWEIPFAHLWSSGPKRLTSGWRLFPILTVQAGQPLSFSAGLYNSHTSPGPSGAGDPNLVQLNLAGSSIQTFDPSQPRTINGVYGNYYFNPNSFAPIPDSWFCQTCVPTASQRTYGTAPRNSLIGPGFTNLDLSLEKRLPLFEERVQAAIRLEAFNILNHPEFWLPNNNINAGNFGQITSVNPNSPSRILQLSMRVNF